MPKINLEQGSASWLHYRQSHIGGTDSSVIMGCNPFKNKMELWKEKLGLEAPQKQNSAMKRGKDLEDEARLRFIKDSKIQVEPCVYQSDEHAWMAASLDGANEDFNILVEIKCPGEQIHKAVKRQREKGIKEYYYCQMQHQMLCTGIHFGYYVSYRPEDEEQIIIIDISLNEKYCRLLLHQEKCFWNKLMNIEQPI